MIQLTSLISRAGLALALVGGLGVGALPGTAELTGTGVFHGAGTFQGTGALHTNDDSQNADPSLTQQVETNEKVADKGEQVELSAGHVDLGPYLHDGEWEFMARDDTTPTPVWRHLSDVIFRVNDAAQLEIPAGDEYSFIEGSGTALVIPQQEIADVVWLGWNTQYPEVVNQVNGTVDFIFEGHEGPGHFSTFVQAGNFSGPQVLWNKSVKESQPASVDLNTHTHANWIFTEPGIHKVRMTVQATLKDGTTASDTQTLTFAIGSSTDAIGALDDPSEQTNEEEPAASANTADSNAANEGDEANAGEGSEGQLWPWIAGGGVALVVAAIAVIAVVRSRKQRALKEEALAGDESSEQIPAER